MKIQLLLRRVDPLDAGHARSDDPAAERAHEPTTVTIGALDAVARSTAAAAAAGPVFHRSSSAAA